ncbi:MAG: glutamate--tRNA ligase family protein [Agriterribacter sp.]
MQFKKTRIAPTPSGYLHLGNVLSFVVTAGLAKKYNASILLRIDDLDRERVRKEYVEDIFNTLTFLNIPWHEGPRNAEEFERKFSQLHRLPLYNNALGHLQENNLVFACGCSRSQLLSAGQNGYPGICMNKQLPLEALGYNWRLMTRNESDIIIEDLQAGNQRFVLPADMQYFIIRKRNGYPAYQLASVTDDMHYGVDLVVRGEDLWNSTLAQLHLAEMLAANSFSKAVFHHHLLLTQNDSKLSKSAGDTSVQSLRKAGKTAGDVFTMIATALGCTQTIERWEDLFECYEKQYNMAG